MRKVGFFASGALVAALLLFSHFCSAAAAQTEVRIGVPPVPEFVPPMIADSEGYFKSRGLYASIQVIPGGQSIPAALQSGSLRPA